MKKIYALFLSILIILSIAIPAYAADPNLDGGGGNMGEATGASWWSPGRDGVRVTVIRDSDNAPMTTPVDFSNGGNSDITVHFEKSSKLTYCKGMELVLDTGKYKCFRPKQAIPYIVNSKSHPASIAAVRSYFCRILLLQQDSLMRNWSAGHISYCWSRWYTLDTTTSCTQ